MGKLPSRFPEGIHERTVQQVDQEIDQQIDQQVDNLPCSRFGLCGRGDGLARRGRLAQNTEHYPTEPDRGHESIVAGTLGATESQLGNASGSCHGLALQRRLGQLDRYRVQPIFALASRVVSVCDFFANGAHSRDCPAFDHLVGEQLSDDCFGSNHHQYLSRDCQRDEWSAFNQ